VHEWRCVRAADGDGWVDHRCDDHRCDDHGDGLGRLVGHGSDCLADGHGDALADRCSGGRP